MKIAKQLLAILAFVPAMAFANEGGFPLDKAPDRQTNMAALQHGAKLFVNYCLNCHAAASMPERPGPDGRPDQAESVVLR